MLIQTCKSIVCWTPESWYRWNAVYTSKDQYQSAAVSLANCQNTFPVSLRSASNSQTRSNKQNSLKSVPTITCSKILQFSTEFHKQMSYTLSGSIKGHILIMKQKQVVFHRHTYLNLKLMKMYSVVLFKSCAHVLFVPHVWNLILEAWIFSAYVPLCSS